MLMIGIARIGNEPFVRHTPDGKPVMEISAAFEHGRRTESGRPVQWVKATLWGPRCEKIAPYLKKGDQVHLVLSEPHVETFEKKDGSGVGFTLRTKIADLELIGKRSDRSEAARDLDPSSSSGLNLSSAPPRSFDALEDDIPF